MQSFEQLGHAHIQAGSDGLQDEQSRLSLAMLQFREVATAQASVGGELRYRHASALTQFGYPLAKLREENVAGHSLNHGRNIIPLRQRCLTDGIPMKMLKPLIALAIFAWLVVTCNTSSTDQPKPAPTPIAETNTNPSLEQLGAAMTEQYKKTPWDVKVFGDSDTSSLAFDCSDDPHPEDVCFMLYKRYPGKDELAVLKMVGVKRVFFRTGFMKKSWEKHL